MAFFEAEVKVGNPQLLEAYIEIFEKAPEVLNVLCDRTVNRNRDHLLADLSRYPGPVVYPIQWKSEKQRRAFFATKGFGKGIPYHRTYGWGKTWHVLVEYLPDGISQIVARNDNPIRQYVTGENQQPFHANTGWQKDDDTFQIWGMIMEDEIETDLIKSYYAIGED